LWRFAPRDLIPLDSNSCELVTSARFKTDDNSLTQRGSRHFYLLFEEEIEALRPMLRAVVERIDEVISYWYQLYVLHFGDDRTLGELEFNDLFKKALAVNTQHLIDGDMDGYAIDTIHAAERLAERRVPFAEVVASLHLYQEAVYRLFAASPPAIDIYTCFDKLSHVRIILIADAYFRSEVAVAGARVKALEREASRLPRSQRLSFHDLIGVSPAMRRLYVISRALRALSRLRVIWL
jgi:hypothetical protein